MFMCKLVKLKESIIGQCEKINQSDTCWNKSGLFIGIIYW